MAHEQMLTKISALLRKAESTDNEHEATAYTEAAQRLAATASIDLAMAQALARQGAGRQPAAAPTQRMVSIGEKGKRGLRTLVELFVAIARANDITCDVSSNSTFVYAYGFSDDIDACEALYASLAVQMVKASEAYVRSGAYKSETVAAIETDRRTGRRSWVEKPVAGVTARLNFHAAFAARIGQRLAAARAEAAAAHAAAGPAAAGHGPAADSGAALVTTAVALRAKDEEIATFYQQTSQARGAWRGSAASAGYSEGARRAGDRAGKTARLGADGQLGGARRALG